MIEIQMPNPHSSVPSLQDLRKRGRWFNSFRGLMMVIGINSSLTAVHGFDNGNVGKQSVAWKEYFAKNSSNKLQESYGKVH